MKLLLAFESSCDDTSVAIINTEYEVLCSLVSTQLDHARFGGVLPELASRLHMQNILRLTQAALEQTGLGLRDMDAVAVSINPGLIGSLLVGLSFAKSLAWSQGLPLITVNHMLAHIFANFIEHPGLRPPFLALVVSGGHSELVHFTDFTQFKVIGKTLDDAAGETFDKAAKLLGLGFPGGPLIDKLAQGGDQDFVKLPRALPRKDNFNFSYSGLKTAILQYLSQQEPAFVQSNLTHIAASIQQAIVDPLVSKTLTYAKQHKIKTILLAGGVAANSRLREELSARSKSLGAEVYCPQPAYCVDNAAMVGAAAIPKLLAEQYSPLSVNAFSAKGTKTL